MTSRFRARNEAERIRENFWRTAKKAARHVPFMEDVVAAYYCALDKETPLRVKGILFAALGYFVLPADAIPDVLVGGRLHRRRGRADGGGGSGPRPPEACASGGGQGSPGSGLARSSQRLVGQADCAACMPAWPDLRPNSCRFRGLHQQFKGLGAVVCPGDGRDGGCGGHGRDEASCRRFTLW